MSFRAEEWTSRALGVGSVADHEGIVAGMRSIMVIGMVSVPIALVVFSHLARIVKSVRVGMPFIVENAGRLKVIAWALLALEVLQISVVAAIVVKLNELRTSGG